MIFKCDTGLAIQRACERDFDTKALHLCWICKIISRTYFYNKFEGVFDDVFKTTPPSLVQLIVCTCCDGILITPNATIETSSLAPSYHEEADTRIMVHVKNITSEGMRNIMIRTVDTDVVAIAIGHFQRLQVHELWIGLALGLTLGSFLFMQLFKLLGASKAVYYHYFMLSHDVILLVSFMVRKRRLCGKHGIFSHLLQVHCFNYPFSQIMSIKTYLIYLNNLCWLSMTEQLWKCWHSAQKTLQAQPNVGHSTHISNSATTCAPGSSSGWPHMGTKCTTTYDCA